MGASEVDADTSTKCCLICTEPIHFTRLGVHACRACASFYKRLTISGKRLVCRKGDNQCVYRKHEKFLCKKCRFDKCVALGMKYLPEEKDDLIDANEPSPSIVRMETLLEKIRIAYDSSNERRRTMELELVKKYNLQRVPDNNEEAYLLTFECVIEALTAGAPEIWRFFQEAFPSLKILSEENQRTLFQAWINPFMMVECVTRTKRIWGRIGKYGMSTVLLCSNLEEVDVWAGPQEEGPLRTELINVILAYAKEQWTKTVPAFEKGNFNEKEMLALFPLLLSESDLPLDSVSEECQPLLDAIRREILDDLHVLYTEDMGIGEYSTRLGNLLTISNTFREAGKLFKEFFRMQVTFFDVYKTEKGIQDLVL